MVREEDLCGRCSMGGGSVMCVDFTHEDVEGKPQVVATLMGYSRECSIYYHGIVS